MPNSVAFEIEQSRQFRRNGSASGDAEFANLAIVASQRQILRLKVQ